MTRTIALAAGGTGGHMFPAQSLAEEAIRRGWKVFLLTDARGMRYADNFPANEIITLEAANPNIKGFMAKASMAAAMGKGVLTARNALRQNRPHIVVGFGGYPSAPGLFAARMMGIPYAVHEQNAVLGRVNRKAAPGAALVAHGFARLDRLPALKGALHQVGNPLRDSVKQAALLPYPALGAGASLNVLIFGGSQGARLFAQVFPDALATLPQDLRARLVVTHQVADAEQDAVRITYKAAGIQAELAPFFADLPNRLAQSHFIIARAGASSVTEISVIGRSSLLVPLGIAMDDHQRANAEVLVDAGAAQIVLEKDLSPSAAAALLLPLLCDDTALTKAARAAQGLVPEDAAATLADLIEDLLTSR